MRRFIVVLGSVMSGLGKGVLSASILKLLQWNGLCVYPLKFDGYLNYDCGTMNPYRHGEVFVLADGTEVDMDFGTYERFLNINLPGKASLTGGKIFKHIIDRERAGLYQGLDVQFIPHVTDFIKEWVKRYYDQMNADIVLIEVGGTVGDIENGYFIEAMRQLSLEEKVIFIQLTYIPVINGEQKTKPTQHSYKVLMSYGIRPDVVFARVPTKLFAEAEEKIRLYTGAKYVFPDPDVFTVYELPIIFENLGVRKALLDLLGFDVKTISTEAWQELVNNLKHGKPVKIGIVGKYTANRDAYASLIEAVTHAAAHLNLRPTIYLIDSENFLEEEILSMNAIIIAGGFGKRGIEGKIEAIRIAREHGIPLLGICLGMQLMAIEYAKNVLGIRNAGSEEFCQDCEPIVQLLPGFNTAVSGRNLRLGEKKVTAVEKTLFHSIYGSQAVKRHRHKYGVSLSYRAKFEKEGLVFSAYSGEIVEAIEYQKGQGIGVQFHPEFTSRFEKPDPIFVWLLGKAFKS